MLVSIEGNIGSGKSTLVANLKEYLPHVILLQEPVEEWNTIKDSSGVTILEKYYKNQKRWAFSFQMMAFITRLNCIRKTIKQYPAAIIVTERSVFTDREIFARMLFDDGKIEVIEYDIYLRWFDEFTCDIKIDKTIYIQTTPELCAERVTKRNRQGELIPLEYLKTCHEYHENWLTTDSEILDGRLCITDWLEQIKPFLQH